jgi:hypothetical protein
MITPSAMRQRVRRKDPERTGPIRHWSTLFRPAKTRSSNMATEQHPDANGGARQADDVVSRAVEIGYEVIEEHIRQGKRVAESLTTARPGQSNGAQNGGGKELIERLLHFYTDLGSLCFELMESIIRNPGVGELLRPQPNGTQAPPFAARASNGSGAKTASVATEVSSALPVRVTLSLDEDMPEHCALGIHELHALDRSKPPLRDVSFHNGSADGRQTLRVSVPNDQPPGTYSGAVIDSSTNEPRGTLSIVVRSNGD